MNMGLSAFSRPRGTPCGTQHPPVTALDLRNPRSASERTPADHVGSGQAVGYRRRNATTNSATIEAKLSALVISMNVVLLALPNALSTA
jgi:hypothetical protein